MRHEVKVVWKDGEEQTYHAQEVYVRDGVLIMTSQQRYGKSQNIPLTNVRIYTVERV